jgi:hypothetical protein
MTLATGSRTERFRQGKALRRETPREAHAELKGSLSRNAVAILAESDRDRVPELVPERYARMSLNPFAFLRGAAAVMATDLAAQPMAGIPVHAGGDSHLMNFGAFVTPEDNIIFDVNDFDETLPGVDFTVDLKRLAASVAVAALGSGATKRQARALAEATVKAYRLHMAALAKLSPLEVWHSRIDLEQEIDRIGNGGLRRKLAGVIAKARGEGLSNDDNFPHLVSGDDPKIVDRPPTIFHLDPKADARHKLGVELQNDRAERGHILQQARGRLPFNFCNHGLNAMERLLTGAFTKLKQKRPRTIGQPPHSFRSVMLDCFRVQR